MFLTFFHQTIDSTISFLHGNWYFIETLYKGWSRINLHFSSKHSREPEQILLDLYLLYQLTTDEFFEFLIRLYIRFVHYLFFRPKSGLEFLVKIFNTCIYLKFFSSFKLYPYPEKRCFLLHSKKHLLLSFLWEFEL